MALDVNPAELAAAAAKLAELAHATGQSLPSGWVLPAGSDPISAEAVPQLNAHAANLLNGMSGVLSEIHKTAQKLGAAAADYTATDDAGARQINGSGGEVLANPVAEPAPLAVRQPPVFNLPAAGASIDPLTMAHQLRGGPGTGPANKLSADVRGFLGGFHPAALAGVDAATQTMQHWVPVGSAAASELTKHRSWLDELGTGLGKLVDGIDTYSNAFTTAKAKHPTPEEITAARQELLKAIRSKNQLGIQAALAKFQEQNARSAETITDYATTVGSKNAENAGSSKTGSGESSSSGSGDSSQMLSTLASTLPSLLSSLMSAGMQLNQNTSDTTEGLDDSGYSDYGSTDYGALTGGGSAGGATPISDITGAMNSSGTSASTVAIGPMPMVGSSGSTASSSSSLPRTSVIEPLSTSSAAAARAAGTGSGMMPYMPMSPGMGGAGGGNNERNRVVAWHPDRLMYVDDTPHTEQVIGEKPTIAPTVTPPTPSQPNQASQSGGSA
ncbi:PPE domain-containing protein [Nocardia vinacea]|uniref:PPE domain-containing protein n=1 Tax=Nocardia vinacea TaxID=96468 RepID=UPI000304DC32|nr:PPE domain-containing protein [Nocardia vinacea]